MAFDKINGNYDCDRLRKLYDRRESGAADPLAEIRMTEETLYDAKMCPECPFEMHLVDTPDGAGAAEWHCTKCSHQELID